MKRRLFRWHRGSLSESLATTKEVYSISDMIAYIIEDYQAPAGYLKKIHISDEGLKDSRCGINWENIYRVMADFNDNTSFCIGYCNFNQDITPQELFETAIRLASDKHSLQEKKGMPYILHPLRIMISVQKEWQEMKCQDKYWDMCTAAVLHGIIEDTNTTFEELSVHGFSQEVINIINILTKQKEETYIDYIQRICESNNRSALIIKMADLRDDIDMYRSQKPLTEANKRQLQYYERALRKIKKLWNTPVYE